MTLDPTTSVYLPDRSPSSMTVVGGEDDRPIDMNRKHVSSVALASMHRRIAAGERPALHPIEDIRFGEGRFTRCQCGFTCTGASDNAMSKAWDDHVSSFRGQYGRGFPIERTEVAAG